MSQYVTRQSTASAPRITRVSALTGKLTTYFKVYQHYIYDHQTAEVDAEAFRQTLNEEYMNQNIDAVSDGITIIRGALTDTMIPSLWVAEEQPQLGRLIDPHLVALLIWKVLTVIKALWPLWVVVGLTWGASIIYTTFFGPKPDYYLPEESGIDQPVTWNEYISWLNGHYWYVCPKDGYAVGERSQYPTIDDVPQELVNAFREHCENAPDISPKEWMNFLYVIGGIVVIGGVIWLIGRFFGGKKT